MRVWKLVFATSWHAKFVHESVETRGWALLKNCTSLLRAQVPHLLERRVNWIGYGNHD